MALLVYLCVYHGSFLNGFSDLCKSEERKLRERLNWGGSIISDITPQMDEVCPVPGTQKCIGTKRSCSIFLTVGWGYKGTVTRGQPSVADNSDFADSENGAVNLAPDCSTLAYPVHGRPGGLPGILLRPHPVSAARTPFHPG